MGCTSLLQCLGRLSFPPSTGQWNEIQLFDWIITNGNDGCEWQQPTGRLTAQVDWLGVRVGIHHALSLHSSSELSELSKWLWPSWQHHKHCQGIIIINIWYLVMVWCYNCNAGCTEVAPACWPAVTQFTQSVHNLIYLRTRPSQSHLTYIPSVVWYTLPFQPENDH